VETVEHRVQHLDNPGDDSSGKVQPSLTYTIDHVGACDSGQKTERNMGKTVEESKAEVKAALGVLQAVAGAVKEAGEIPAGHLYAMVMGHLDLPTFNRIVDTLTRAAVIVRRGDLLVWNVKGNS
jgi:hypothetical protein